jgi:PmbA protein
LIFNITISVNESKSKIFFFERRAERDNLSPPSGCFPPQKGTESQECTIFAASTENYTLLYMLTPEQASRYIALTDHVVEYALRQGCTAARAEMNYIEHFNIDTHNRHVDTLQQSTGVGMTLRLFVDGRYGTYSTNRLDASEIEQLIRQGVSITRCLSPDLCRTLPDPARYYRNTTADSVPDLGNYDTSILSTTADTKRDLALQTAQALTVNDPRIITLDTAFQDRIGWQYLSDSQGFHGESRAGICSLVASVNLQGEGDCRPSDYEHRTAVGYGELHQLMDELPQSLADSAYRRAERKVGQHRIEAGHYTIVIEPRVVGKLLDPLIDVLFGAALYQKRSFLADRLGEVVASPLLTLTDEPQRYGAQGACLFDFEGVATATRDIFRDGVLCTYFFDTYYAHKLQTTPTFSGPTVLSMTPGARSMQEMLRSQPRVLLLTGFNGGNYNEVTGDYSFGIEGQLYEQGEAVTAVSEMNMTGHLIDLWKHLVEVGNEQRQTATGFIPSLMFEGVKIG